MTSSASHPQGRQAFSRIGNLLWAWQCSWRVRHEKKKKKNKKKEKVSRYNNPCDSDSISTCTNWLHTLHCSQSVLYVQSCYSVTRDGNKWHFTQYCRNTMVAVILLTNALLFFSRIWLVSHCKVRWLAFMHSRDNWVGRQAVVDQNHARRQRWWQRWCATIDD